MVVTGEAGLLAGMLGWAAYHAAKAVLIALLGLIIFVVCNPWHRFRLRHVPGPGYRPIFGNLHEFKTIGSHEFMLRCRQQYGPVFKIWAGHTPWIIVADPELGRRVNYKLINRPARTGDPLLRGAMVKPENKGLFFSRDDHWRHLARIWQPVFYPDSVRATAPAMEATTQRLLGRLDALAAEGQPLDIWREVGNLTMGVVGTAAYGIDFHTLESPDAPSSRASSPASPTPSSSSSRGAAAHLTLSKRLAGTFATASADPASSSLDSAQSGRELIEAAKVLFKGVSATSGSMYHTAALVAPAALTRAVNFAAHVWPDAAFRRLLEARHTMCAASLGLVRQAKRDAAQQQQAHGGEAAAPSPKAAAAEAAPARPTGATQRARGAIAPGSFLATLLGARDKAGRGLTDAQLLLQCNTFTLAGYETTANTLAFSLFCLATHPEAEARLLQEVRGAAAHEAAAKAAASAAGEPHTPWCCRDLEQQFPWVCAVVSEALRLYPPGATTMRETPQDAPFQLGPHVLPPGSAVFVATYVMQRDPELWPQADAFLPERWLPGNEHLAAKHPGAYLPFGSGGRQCIGQRFALQEVRLALVQLLQRYHFEVAWNMMPSGGGSGSAPQQDSSGKPARSLKTTNYFTLCPADGIWVRIEPRVQPAGTPLL